MPMQEADHIAFQKALREKEEAFCLMASCVDDCAFYLLDPDGHITTWNAGAEHIKGYQSEEILGKHFSAFYTPEDIVKNLPQEQLKISAAQGRYDHEGWLIRKDGSRFLARQMLTVLRTENGEIRGFANVTRDTSTHKRLEERFQRVVESAPSAMVMINSFGRIEMVNAQAEQVFGYPRAEMLGQPIEILVPNRFRSTHPTLRTEFFSDPQSRPMGAGRDLFGLRKDGSEFPIEIGLNPIETEDGIMVLSAIVDISTRRRLEERFRQVVEWAPNAMVMINSEGTIEMVNAQTERVFGYRRAEILGKSIEVLVPERFRAHHPGLRAMFFSAPISRPMGAGRDLFGLRKDGSEFPVEIGLNPIETDEGPKVLSSIVDISDRKQKELRIEAALHEKDILLGEVHHRVKNNLQIVSSMLDLQAGRISDEVVLGMLRDSQNRIRSMALIHQTLYQSTDFAKVDFAAVLDALVPALITSYSVDPSLVSVGIRTKQLLLPINQAIPCGLIVNELIANVFKHAFPKLRKGQVDIELKQDPSQWAMLSVSDDGVGMDKQLDLKTSKTLGLTLVTLLAKQLGGTVTIQHSAPTKFTLAFPINLSGDSVDANQNIGG